MRKLDLPAAPTNLLFRQIDRSGENLIIYIYI